MPLAEKVVYLTRKLKGIQCWEVGFFIQEEWHHVITDSKFAEAVQMATVLNATLPAFEDEVKALIHEKLGAACEVFLNETDRGLFVDYIQTAFLHKSALNRHIAALACFCECAGMSAMNEARKAEGCAPAYPDVPFFAVMQKWGLINEKGEPQP